MSVSGVLSSVAALAIFAGCTAVGGSPGGTSDEAGSSYVGGSDCANERETVTNAKVKHEQSGDVDGDGVPDTVYVGQDPTGKRTCRTFLVVDTGDVTYSVNVTLLDRGDGDDSSVATLVDFGGSAGVEIVLRQPMVGIERLTSYRILTLHDDKLAAVTGPGSQVLDDPFGRPAGATCTPDGKLVVSDAFDPYPFETWKVNRHYYELTGTRLHQVGHETGEVDLDQPIAGTYPEFESPLFSGC